MGSITGVLLVISFAGGLSCRRPTTAAIFGATLAVIYAALVVSGLWHVLADANLPYVLGALTIVCLAIAAPAMLACHLRRLVAKALGSELSKAS